MPEGVELDTEGEEVIIEEEKPIGPPTVLDIVPSYDSVSYFICLVYHCLTQYYHCYFLP